MSLEALIAERKAQAEKKRRQKETAGFGLTADERMIYEERAAIIEHEGGLSKPEAERLALEEVISNRVLH